MPRPTVAQLAYGACTVIFSTLAMLLLSQTSSGLGIAVISVSALGLGLLVAWTVPLSRPASKATASRPKVAAVAERGAPVERAKVSTGSAPAEPLRESA